jgi:hypothetical protein
VWPAEDREMAKRGPDKDTGQGSQRASSAPASPARTNGYCCRVLRAIRSATALKEHASGANRSRPVLARLQHDVAAGGTVLARSSRPLGQPPSGRSIEQLEAQRRYISQPA